MKMQVESRLMEMIGNTYMYKQNNHKILRFEVTDITTRIITDIKDIIFPTEEAIQKMKAFLQVDEALVLHTITVPDSVDDPDSGAGMSKFPELIIHKHSTTLSDLLMQNIKDLQEDPEKNMSKAVAINDQVKSFLDVAKIEVEALKVAAYVHKAERMRH